MFFSIFVALFGLAFGSFFNVCIYRIPLHQSIIPDSHCPNCKHKIKWFHNIPLLSFILLHGKCKYCHSKIPFQYPLVEFLTAFFFLILFWKSNEHFSVIFFQDVLLFSLGMNIFFIDLQHKIIPDALTLLVAISGILFSFFSETPLNWEQSLLGFFTGFVSFVLVAYLCKWMLKKDCLGGGDIKLIAGLGAFVGVIGVFITIFIASVVALVTLLVIKHDLKKEFPFGPFLIVGVLIYHFFGAHLITLYLAIWSL